MSNKVLFVVEGEKTEPELLKKIKSSLYLTEEMKIFSYKTNIYHLYKALNFDEHLDLPLLLKEGTRSKRDRTMLSQNFNAIYLIFDFEPQDPNFSIEKLCQLIDFFSDSTDKGLLLINYPMIEAFKHLKAFPDKDFLDRKIRLDEITRYRSIVGEESKFTHVDKYHRDVIMKMIVHHLVKMNYILTGEKRLPTDHEIFDYIQNKLLFNQQCEVFAQHEMYILSTIFYFLIELKPKSFYEQFKLPFIDELCL